MSAFIFARSTPHHLQHRILAPAYRQKQHHMTIPEPKVLPDAKSLHQYHQVCCVTTTTLLVAPPLPSPSSANPVTLQEAWLRALNIEENSSAST